VIGRSAEPSEIIESVMFVRRSRSLGWSIKAHGLTIQDWRGLEVAEECEADQLVE
jgi:hypothetical protein